MTSSLDAHSGSRIAVFLPFRGMDHSRNHAAESMHLDYRTQATRVMRPKKRRVCQFEIDLHFWHRGTGCENKLPAGKPILAVPSEVTMTNCSISSSLAASTRAMAPSPSIFLGLLKLNGSLSGAPIACTT